MNGGHTYSTKEMPICIKCGKTHINPFLGKHHSKATKIKVGLKISKLFKNVKKSEAHKKNISMSLTGKLKSDKHCKNISSSLKNTYKQHPEIVQKMCSSDNTKPNSFENRLLEVISDNKLPYRYVGNGKFWLTYNNKNINPDFIAKKPNNIVIEVFSNHFKIKNFGSVKNYMKLRKEAFKHFGYKVLFFNENSLVDNHRMANKLNRFIYA